MIVSHQSLNSIASCPPPPSRSLFHFAVCTFGGFGEIAFSSNKLDDSPQHRNISCNAKQFNFQLERLMSCKQFDVTLNHLCLRCTIRHYTEPFHAMLYYLFVRCAIRYYAKPFHATLYRLCVRCTIRCTIRHYAKPFHATLHCLYVCCAIRHYAEPFHATLHCLFYAVQFDILVSHFTPRYTVCVYTAVPFDITLSHFTQRYTVCVLCCKLVLS